MTNRNKHTYTNNWSYSDYLPSVKAICWFVAVSGSIIFILYLTFGRDVSAGVKKSVKANRNNILVDTLTELPKGPYLHRIVDLELRKVCYLNAAGGGIKCYDLDEITLGNLKLKKKLETKSNASRASLRRTYNYNSGKYQYNGTKDDDN